jgi:hypothetical protein
MWLPVRKAGILRLTQDWLRPYIDAALKSNGLTAVPAII